MEFNKKNLGAHYFGDGKTKEVFFCSDSRTLKLKPSSDSSEPIWSRDFNWGYSGNGPAQLAFSILYHQTKNIDFSEKSRFKFRDKHLLKFKMDENFRLNSSEVKPFISKEKKEYRKMLKKIKTFYYGDGSTHKVYICSKESDDELPSYSDIDASIWSRDFNWGYIGSGPAQLAFSILYNQTKDIKFSRKHTMKFRDKHIANFIMNEDFELDIDKINSFISEEIRLSSLDQNDYPEVSRYNSLNFETLKTR